MADSRLTDAQRHRAQAPFPEPARSDGVPEWAPTRNAIAEAAGRTVELTASQLPLDGKGVTKAGLGIRVLRSALRPATGASHALQDHVQIGCSPTTVMDLGLFVIASVLHNRFGIDAVLGVGFEGIWHVRVNSTADERAHLRPATAVLACFDVRPYEPVPGVDLYIAGSQSGEAATGHILTIEGTQSGLCSFGSELVRMASGEIPTESRAEHILASAPSSDVRIRVAPLSSLERMPSGHLATEDHPVLPSPGPVRGNINDVVATEIAQWQALRDLDELTVTLRIVPEFLSSAINLTFAAEHVRGGMTSLVRLSGTETDLLALGMWLATSAVSFDRTSTLVTPAGVTLSLNSFGFADTAGAQIALMPDGPEAKAIADTIAHQDRSLILNRGYRPEISDFDIDPYQLDFVAHIADAAGPMTHIRLAGSPPKLAALAETVMSIATSSTAGPWDLSPFVRPDRLSVELLVE